LLDGVDEIHVLLTHFHLDRTCGLPYVASPSVRVTVWAPGRWLYGVDSADILGPLRRPPLSRTDVTSTYAVNELREGRQQVDGFEVRASTQPRYWTPTAGLRIDDDLALITDPPYEPTSSALARGVAHLLHEAWSSSAALLHPDRDATAADAAQVARDADVGQLTLVRLNPMLPDHSPLLEDARQRFDRATLGDDEAVLTPSRDSTRRDAHCVAPPRDQHQSRRERRLATSLWRWLGAALGFDPDGCVGRFDGAVNGGEQVGADRVDLDGVA
jgi:ribonuclease BN (tRNA processing enzyme)